MARKRYNPQPVTGGIRKRRTTSPRMAGGADSTIVEYAALGINVTTDGSGLAESRRYYTPGSSNRLTSFVGPEVVSNYSTGKFLPGTKIRWEPSVSFTTSGRIYVGFTDNPEVMTRIATLGTLADWVNAVQSMGGMISFPVWQETEINFPTRCRRKYFDTNVNASFTVDELDRTCQTMMVCGVNGAPATTTLGSFWFHDKVAVEGLQNVGT